MPEKGDSTIEMAVNQSRINLKTTKMFEGQKVTGFIEEDFYGNGTGFGTFGSASNVHPDLVIRYSYNGLSLTAQDPVYQMEMIQILVWVFN